MENLEIKNISYAGGETRFVAYQNNQPCGYLSYLTTDSYVWIIHVKSYLERMKIGTSLVKRFVDFFPDKTPIRAIISHTGTMEALKENCLLKLPESGIRRLTNKQISGLPIVRFLDSGGIITSGLTVSYDTSIKGNPYNVLLKGVTQKEL